MTAWPILAAMTSNDATKYQHEKIAPKTDIQTAKKGI